MGKFTISVAIFNSKLLVYQRVNLFPMVFLWFPIISWDLWPGLRYNAAIGRPKAGYHKMGLGQQGQPLKIDTHTHIYTRRPFHMDITSWRHFCRMCGKSSRPFWVYIYTCISIYMCVYIHIYIYRRGQQIISVNRLFHNQNLTKTYYSVTKTYYSSSLSLSFTSLL